MSSSTYRSTLIRIFKKMYSDKNGKTIDFTRTLIQKLEPLLQSCMWTGIATGAVAPAHSYTSNINFKSYSIYDNSKKLSEELDNIKEEQASNFTISTKILNRVQEAIVKGNLVINTIGITIPPPSTSPIPINQDSTKSNITILTTPLSITTLTNNFESMNNSKQTDDNVATYITNNIMTMINSITFTCTFTGLLVGSGNGNCKGV